MHRVLATSSWTTNTTIVAMGGRVGDRLHGDIEVQLAGAPDTATFTVTLSDYTIDTSKIPGYAAGNVFPVGTAYILDSGTASRMGLVLVSVGTPPVLVVYATTAATTVAVVTQAVPQTWASGDRLRLDFTVPVQ